MNYLNGSPVVLFTAVPISLSLVLSMMDPHVNEATLEQEDFRHFLKLSVSCEWQKEKAVQLVFPPTA